MTRILLTSAAVLLLAFGTAASAQTTNRDTRTGQGVTPSEATPGERSIPVNPNAQPIDPQSNTGSGGSVTPLPSPQTRSIPGQPDARSIAPESGTTSGGGVTPLPSPSYGSPDQAPKR